MRSARMTPHYYLTLTHVKAGASPTGGRGGHDPRTFENRGGRPPRNLDNAVTFFLKSSFLLYLSTFQNKVGVTGKIITYYIMYITTNFRNQYVCTAIKTMW